MDNVRRYRYGRSRADQRDYLYVNSGNTPQPTVDLRPYATLVEDQSTLGSCVGEAVTAAYELMTVQKYPSVAVQLSELFVYYNARAYEGTIASDSGASIRNALRGLKIYGVCDETLWPYDISKFTTQPSEAAYSDAAKRAISKYYRVLGIPNVLDAMSSGYPVVAGMTVTANFMTLDRNNYALVKHDYYEPPLDGHAVLIVGYDIPNKTFTLQNSFGTDWGLDGYFTMSFDYAEDWIFESWVYDIPQLVAPQQLQS